MRFTEFLPVVLLSIACGGCARGYTAEWIHLQRPGTDHALEIDGRAALWTEVESPYGPGPAVSASDVASAEEFVSLQRSHGDASCQESLWGRTRTALQAEPTNLQRGRFASLDVVTFTEPTAEFERQHLLACRESDGYVGVFHGVTFGAGRGQPEDWGMVLPRLSSFNLYKTDDLSPETRKFHFAGETFVEFEAPASWRVARRLLCDGITGANPTDRAVKCGFSEDRRVISIEPPDGRFDILMTVYGKKRAYENEPGAATDLARQIDPLPGFVQRLRDQKQIDGMTVTLLEPVQAGDVRGFRYRATYPDPPPPGQCPQFEQGVVEVGALLVKFTYGSCGDATAYDEGRKIVASLRATRALLSPAKA